ncbi:MAG: Gfo/Idh/MocA family oxidoreductase [Chloroflexi bacterium]|nr:Gfo/Idh/MocA family oxidoreductase [Chloroflexota bacterium]
MRQKLNWGFLSTAKINRALIKPLAASKRTRLLAVASRSQSSADAYAREWNIPRAHGSYEALLADPEIDVIYNSLPNDLHAEWTIKALRAGKHVLCEKPIALTVTELDAMAAAAKESGRVLAEAFMYRHHPQTLKIKEMVDSSLLGQLQLIRGSFTFTLTRQTHRSDPYRGGGSIWDVGCYPISYARMIVGAEPLEVFGWQAKGPTGIDETFVGQMRFADGIHAQFDCGFNSPSRTHIEVIGTQGMLDIPVPFKPGAKETIFVTRRDRTETIKIKGQELYLGEVEDMVDAILLGKPPRVSLADSRANISTILALIESSETGRPILL